MMICDKSSLPEWGECIGPFSKLTTEEGHIIADIGNIRLVLPSNLEQNLKPLMGRRIAILRTDLPEKPYLYRVLAQEDEASKQ